MSISDLAIRSMASPTPYGKTLPLLSVYIIPVNNPPRLLVALMHTSGPLKLPLPKIHIYHPTEHCYD